MRRGGAAHADQGLRSRLHGRSLRARPARRRAKARKPTRSVAAKMRLANGLCLAVEAADARTGPGPGSAASPPDISWRTHDRRRPHPRRHGPRAPPVPLRAVRRRRARQHRPHRGGHGRHDRGQGPAGVAGARRGAGRDRRPRRRARRGAAVRAHGPPRSPGRPRRGLRHRRRRRARRDRRRRHPLVPAAPGRHAADRLRQPATSCRATRPPTWSRRRGGRPRSASSSGRRRSARSSARGWSRSPPTWRGPSGCRRSPARTSSRSCSSASRPSSRSCSCGPTRTSSPTSRRARIRAAEPGRLGPVREILRRPAVAAAIVALVVGQFVMVLIMTMTPLHMAEHGHDLGAVGLVLSAPHARDVRAVAALGPAHRPVRQRADDLRWARPSSAVASLMAAVAPPDGGVVLFVALFLLGFGWNLGFVAGSAMLSEPRDPRADAGPGRGRRADLELRRGREPGLRADHGRRGLHGPRDPRRGRGHHPGDRPALAPRGDARATDEARAAEAVVDVPPP